MSGDAVDDGQRRELSLAVAGVLAEAEVEIAGRGAVCRSSGRCCRFEEWGQRLYVTGVELAHFQEVGRRKLEVGGEKKEGVSLEQFFAGGKVAGCPYQVGGLCTAREARPLGCRVYFCDAGAQGWQNEVYEKYHARLKEVHERFGVAYRYVEWREGLRELAAKT
jgi:Fe-S-cluster containining protein